MVWDLTIHWLFFPKTRSQSEIQKLPNRNRKLIIQIFRDKSVWDESSYSRFDSFSRFITNIAIEIHVVKFKSVWSCSSKETNMRRNHKRESIWNCGHREWFILFFASNLIKTLIENYQAMSGILWYIKDGYGWAVPLWATHLVLSLFLIP